MFDYKLYFFHSSYLINLKCPKKYLLKYKESTPMSVQYRLVRDERESNAIYQNFKISGPMKPNRIRDNTTL